VSDPSADAETRADRRSRYHAVVACVAANCHVDPETRGVPGCPRRQVVVSLAAHGQHDPDRVRSSLRAAVENTDVYRWTDRRGEPRFTPVAEEPLCQLTHHVASIGHPDKQSIAADCNRLRQEMSDR
jgi:hypothetical protein